MHTRRRLLRAVARGFGVVAPFARPFITVSVGSSLQGNPSAVCNASGAALPKLPSALPKQPSAQYTCLHVFGVCVCVCVCHSVCTFLLLCTSCACVYVQRAVGVSVHESCVCTCTRCVCVYVHPQTRVSNLSHILSLALFLAFSLFPPPPPRTST